MTVRPSATITRRRLLGGGIACALAPRLAVAAPARPRIGLLGTEPRHSTADVIAALYRWPAVVRIVPSRTAA